MIYNFSIAKNQCFCEATTTNKMQNGASETFIHSRSRCMAKWIIWQFFSLSNYFCPFKWVSGGFLKLIQIWTTTVLYFGREIWEKSFWGFLVGFYAFSIKKLERFDHLLWIAMPPILIPFKKKSKNIKKHQKNAKPALRVILCVLLPKKNTKLELW